MIDINNIRSIYKKDYNLRHLTWFKTGGNAEFFLRALDLADLSLFLSQNLGNTEKLVVIGAGSNIIIRDRGIEGIVVKLGNNFSQIQLIDDNLLEVGASCLNFNLAKFCLAHSLAGLEFLIGIPGTVGGGIFMNAGSYGREFAEIVRFVEFVDIKGQIFTLDAKDIKFNYRHTNIPGELIITKAWLQAMPSNQELITKKMNEITTKRASSQPITQRTGGSTFANPEDHKAWQLIDQSGLRGYQIGGAFMSKLHCNFMINDGTATSNDLEKLGEFVREKVYKDSGILLKWEIKILGHKDA